MAKLTLILSGDDAQQLSIAVNRTDVAPGEPASLQRWHDLKPGEKLTLEYFPGSLISIAESRRD